MSVIIGQGIIPKDLDNHSTKAIQFLVVFER